MANNRKFNKVMMSGASSQNNSTQLSPSAELERSYDPQELYESRVQAAQEKADKLVEEEAIYQEAKRQCQEMVLKTQTRLAELRKVSNDYMDDALRRTEEAIAISLEDVRDTRTKFKALIENQEKKANAVLDVEE